jgi:putative ABC transport system permease protein
MLSPRWRKVIRDLWGNKLRTTLVVLSIAVGVFAVGMILGTQETVMTALDGGWNATNPPHIIFYTDPFDENLLFTVRHTPGVREADGKRTVFVRFKDPAQLRAAAGAPQAGDPPADPAKWRNLNLASYADFDNARVGRVFPQSGAWPPAEQEVLIERASLAWMNAKVGDTLLVEAPNGRQRELRITGVTHDPGQMQASWGGAGAGYINQDTLTWLGVSRDMDELDVIATDAPTDRKQMNRLAQEVRNKIEKSGRTVYYTYIPQPGKHPAGESVQPILMVLGVLGFMSLGLSGLLVINTMQALLTQQVRQMGIMKAIGGRSGQIMGIYYAMVFAFGLLALAVAVPLGALGAQGLTGYMATLLNFDVRSFDIPPRVLALEVLIGLAVPLVAALYPIISAVRITPREAMSDYGLAASRAARPSRLALGRGDRPGSKRLPTFGKLATLNLLIARPALLSIRNTFRRRGRLALTLATLILGGAIFIAVFSVRDSVLTTLDNMFAYVDYDAIVQFRRPYRIDLVEREALTVPGVAAAEGWRFDNGRRMRPDDTESDPVFVRGVKADSALVKPRLVEGRWLLPNDENAIVINTMLLKDETDLKVGSALKLKLSGRETDWRVVGIVSGTPPAPMLHVNYPYLARIMGAVDRAGLVIVTTQDHAPAAQASVAKALEEHFKTLGIEVGYRQTSTEESQQIIARFDVLIVFLMIMAVLLAVVGAIGLAGTMSLNVLERTREIGVMRAIGASDGSVFGIVVIEGLLIGLISWGVGALLAYPLGKVLSDAVGNITMKVGMDYNYSFTGVFVWLAVASVLAVLASLLPARNASRVSVRDVLAYE